MKPRARRPKPKTSETYPPCSRQQTRPTPWEVKRAHKCSLQLPDSKLLCANFVGARMLHLGTRDTRTSDNFPRSTRPVLVFEVFFDTALPRVAVQTKLRYARACANVHASAVMRKALNAWNWSLQVGRVSRKRIQSRKRHVRLHCFGAADSFGGSNWPGFRVHDDGFL